VIYKQDLKTGPLNDIASQVFQVSLRGKVLVVPVQQLPAEWDLMEEEDRKYTAEEVDCGFLISLQAMMTANRLAQENFGIYSPDGSALFSPQMKEEWIFNPAVEEDTNEDDYMEFYKMKMYPFVIKAKKKAIKENILFEDKDVIVKTRNSRDYLAAVNQLIQIYETTEEYEKCAELQKVSEIARKYVDC
jgi:hypothetical protein